MTDPRLLAPRILDYWFADLDDASALDREREPFRTCYARWYGKDPAVDQEIREAFAPALLEVTGQGADWFAQVQRWTEVPRGLLALTVLLDQLPRNMYREQRRMYRHDALALSVAVRALQEIEADETLPLAQQMFLYVPLMHAEDLTLQQAMVQRFEQLVELARTRSPHNVRFFEFALGYARKHEEVIARFGRFPHRNGLLGRSSTAEEEEYLRKPGAGF
jgi:uncharacterized protein (DUF924 family)